MAAPKTEPLTAPRDHHPELVPVSLDGRGVQGPESPPDLPHQRIKTDGAQSGQPDRNKEPRGSGKKPTRWLNFNNALNKLLPGAKFLRTPKGGKISWVDYSIHTDRYRIRQWSLCLSYRYGRLPRLYFSYRLVCQIAGEQRFL